MLLKKLRVLISESPRFVALAKHVIPVFHWGATGMEQVMVWVVETTHTEVAG